ncbi:hypothetical protein B4Q13_16195, partial [Lacticaseibacillus rhamnosus]
AEVVAVIEHVRKLGGVGHVAAGGDAAGDTDRPGVLAGPHGGIGAATATLLAEQGQKVVIGDIAPEPLAGTQTILWPAPVDVASESAVVSGLFLPNIESVPRISG